MTTSNRLIVVSNRLPVTVKANAGGGATLVLSAGGLATALGGWHTSTSGLWVGWSGVTKGLEPYGFDAVDQRMVDRGLVPVELTAQEVEGYYEDFSNGVLWPLCHYLLDRVPVAEHDWRTYQTVNEKFADAVVAHYRPGDRIWVHDYHLMLVPQLIRQRVPDARIGFFLHVPFPSSEIFRILPWRTELLEGLLGADLIGFHTYGYVRHFAMAVLHILGIEPDVDRIVHGPREIQLRAMPIGIDGNRFAELAAEPAVREEASAIRRESGGRRILLGIDRLDYTKGLPRRLLAVEHLLNVPEWHDRIRFIQVAVPTRDRVESYRGFKRQVEQLVGRINGAHGTVGALPIHYLYRTVPIRQLVALYLAADVMLVTPLRDGLNLVAKEFVASRIDDEGVLVLSEFAGAASELGEAVIVNPYDVSGLSDAMDAALRMSASERRIRMRALRSRVLSNTAILWADEFVEALATTPAVPPDASRVLEPEALRQRLASQLDATPLGLVLDYDGTMVAIQPTPELAVPDDSLMVLIQRLADSPGLTVHLVSGRPREVLDKWFGGLPVDLWAEHGFWHRDCFGGEWSGIGGLPEGWRERILPIMRHFTAATPGSSIEEKSASVTWHYRLADPEFGTRQAHELRMLLGDALSNQPLEVKEGKKVLEVRLRGVNKGLAIQGILSSNSPPAAIVAVGDDPTDEDMFAALREPFGIGVHVGRDSSLAPHSLADPLALRRWLELLLAHRSG